MTATKATGLLAVLSRVQDHSGERNRFSGLSGLGRAAGRGTARFSAAYSGPVRDTTWVYFGARFDSEEQMNACTVNPSIG
jgi:hypothetical protein